MYKLLFKCFVPGYSYRKRATPKKPNAGKRLSWAPVPKQEVQASIGYDRIGKPYIRIRKDEDVARWQKHAAVEIANHIRKLSPEPKIPFDGYLVLRLDLYLPAPKTTKFPAGLDILPKITKPDSDNYQKPIGDVLDRTPEFLEKAGVPFLLRTPIVVNDSRFFDPRPVKYIVKDPGRVGVVIKIYELNINQWIKKRLEKTG